MIFAVLMCNGSRDIVGVPNFQNGSRDLGHTQFRDNFLWL